MTFSISVPPSIYEKLVKWFNFPSKEIYAQMATCAHNHPRIRTMWLFEITVNGELIFLTHRQTQKWQDLSVCNRVAVSLPHLPYGVLTVEGDATLHTTLDSSSQRYWIRFPLNVQKIYTPNPTLDPPDTLGIIIVSPRSWELLEVNTADYNQSVRKHFIKAQEGWQVKDVKPI